MPSTQWYIAHAQQVSVADGGDVEWGAGRGPEGHAAHPVSGDSQVQ